MIRSVDASLRRLFCRKRRARLLRLGTTLRRAQKREWALEWFPEVWARDRSWFWRDSNSSSAPSVQWHGLRTGQKTSPGRPVFAVEHLMEALLLLPVRFRNSCRTAPTLDFRYRISDTLSVRTFIRPSLKKATGETLEQIRDQPPTPVPLKTDGLSF